MTAPFRPALRYYGGKWSTEPGDTMKNGYFSQKQYAAAARWKDLDGSTIPPSSVWETADGERVLCTEVGEKPSFDDAYDYGPVTRWVAKAHLYTGKLRVGEHKLWQWSWSLPWTEKDPLAVLDRRNTT